MYKKYVTGDRLILDRYVLVIIRNDNTWFILEIVSLSFLKRCPRPGRPLSRCKVVVPTWDSRF